MTSKWLRHICILVWFLIVSQSMYPSFYLAPEHVSLEKELDLVDLRQSKYAAVQLGGILDSLRYDYINKLLRRDYYDTPLPSNNNLGALKGDLQNILKAKRLTQQEVFAFQFFMLGRALSKDQLSKLIPDASLVRHFIQIGLFIVEDSKVKMNGLAVGSKRLKNGKVMYFLADIPRGFPTAMYEQRVYTGPDSYYLNERLAKLDKVQGFVAETGSGSGMHLISTAMLNDDVQKAIGLEIDARAISVSRFNAMLNHVDDRVSIVENEESFAEELNGEQLSLAFSNPPFFPATESSKSVLGLPGWGGEDGLEITRKFIELLYPVMGDQGEIYIFSQFAGDDSKPTCIHNDPKGRLDFNSLKEEGFSSKFEQMYRWRAGKRDKAEVMSSESWAVLAGEQLLVDNPDVSEDAVRDMKRETLDMLEKQDISRIYTGFAVLKKDQKGDDFPVEEIAFEGLDFNRLFPASGVLVYELGLLPAALLIRDDDYEPIGRIDVDPYITPGETILGDWKVTLIYGRAPSLMDHPAIIVQIKNDKLNILVFEEVLEDSSRHNDISNNLSILRASDFLRFEDERAFLRDRIMHGISDKPSILDEAIRDLLFAA